MTPIRFNLRAILTSAVAVLFVAGCGGSDEKNAEAPASEAAQTAAPENSPTPARKMAPLATGKKAAPAPAPKTGEITTDSVADRLAVKVELPDYYPDDAPVYPGSMPSQAVLTEDGQASVTFGIDDDAENVANFAREFVLKNGWAMSLDQEIEGGHLLRASKGPRQISILVGEVEDAAMMSVAVHR